MAMIYLDWSDCFTMRIFQSYSGARHEQGDDTDCEMHSGVIDKPTAITLGEGACFIFWSNIRIPTLLRCTTPRKCGEKLRPAWEACTIENDLHCVTR